MRVHPRTRGQQASTSALRQGARSSRLTWGHGLLAGPPAPGARNLRVYGEVLGKVTHGVLRHVAANLDEAGREDRHDTGHEVLAQRLRVLLEARILLLSDLLDPLLLFLLPALCLLLTARGVLVLHGGLLEWGLLSLLVTPSSPWRHEVVDRALRLHNGGDLRSSLLEGLLSRLVSVHLHALEAELLKEGILNGGLLSLPSVHPLLELSLGCRPLSSLVPGQAGLLRAREHHQHVRGHRWFRHLLLRPLGIRRGRPILKEEGGHLFGAAWEACKHVATITRGLRVHRGLDQLLGQGRRQPEGALGLWVRGGRSNLVELLTQLLA
mmetsp:Transcript_48009/g.104815  ORF Transcript_48009/g.104815 Transcript_48009/m.104815 type:complete len:324 (+) Transcript_48009:8-979(+)